MSGAAQQYEPPGTGENPAPGIEWQIGKTAASIRFVNHAENFIASGNATEDDIQLLSEAASAVRSGERVLTEWVEIESFLVSGFPS
jgi:hypothetical protein